MDAGLVIDVVVLCGVAIVLPLALGDPVRWWVSACAALIALVAPTGPAAAAVAAIWLAIAVVTAVQALFALRIDSRWSATTPALIRLGATGFAVVAAGAFVQSRAGLTIFDIREPIVELTAVHFTYAGVGALTLAGAVMQHSVGARLVIARIGAMLTFVAPPVVAIGFVASHPLPQLGGAALMTVGVLTTAALQLVEASRSSASAGARGLLAVSGVAPWLPMGLALAWASSLYWSVPALSIPDMARTHGIMNAVFVIAGLLARSSMQDDIDLDLPLHDESASETR